jgi:plasmid stabilization system protein ParE
MSRSAQEILEEARQLPPDEVDWIIESLLIKDTSPAEPQIKAAWDSEIKRRLDEIDSGAVEMIPAERVHARMIARLSPAARARMRLETALVPSGSQADEIDGAYTWYASEARSGGWFLRGAFQCLRHGAISASQFPPYLHGTRRVLLDRYPFSVVFRELPRKIQIVAVAHAKRRPGYWAKRL